MEERRWPWFISGVLLLGTGVTGAASTYLWWLPWLGVAIALGSATAEGVAYPLATVVTLLVVLAVVILLASPIRRPSRFIVTALAASSMVGRPRPTSSHRQLQDVAG